MPATLLPGVTPKNIRILCDNPYEGGGGYTPREVGDMTLDQFYMRTVEFKLLRSPKATRTLDAVPLGEMKGRAADGTPLKAIVRGRSLCSELNEKAALRKKAAKQETKRDRKRRRRKKEAPNGS